MEDIIINNTLIIRIVAKIYFVELSAEIIPYTGLSSGLFGRGT